MTEMAGRYGDPIARKLREHNVSPQSYVPLPIGSWVEVDGTPLVAFSNGDSTTPGWELAGSKAWGIRWNNHATPDPVSQSVPLPNDLDDSAAVVVHVLAAKTGATVGDATAWTIGAFFQIVGGLYDADADAGGDSSAMTGNATAKTVQELTLTISADDVPASPCNLTVTIQPKDGTLGTDDAILLAAWLEYTPKLIS